MFISTKLPLRKAREMAPSTSAPRLSPTWIASAGITPVRPCTTTTTTTTNNNNNNDK